MPNPYDGLPSELEDIDRYQAVDRGLMSHRGQELLRQSAPHKSSMAYLGNKIGQERQMRGMDIQRNQHMRARADQQMRWQADQDERNMRNQFMQKLFDADQEERRYRREQGERQSKAAYYQALMNSQNPYERLEAQERLAEIYGIPGGGSSAPEQSAPSNFVQQAQSELVGPQAGPMRPQQAGGAVSPKVQYLRDQIERQKQEDERRRRLEDEDRAERKRERDTDRAWQQDQRARASREQGQASTRARLERIATDPTRSPQDRAEAERRLAMLDSDAQIGDAPNLGTTGVAGGVSGMLANAFRQAAQGSRDQIANDPTFAADPRAQKRWEAQQDIASKRADYDVGAAGREIARAPVDEAVNRDPDFQMAVEDLRSQVRQVGDLPWWQDLGDAFKFGIWEPTKTGQPAIDQIINSLGRQAEAIASKYNADPQAVLNRLVAELGGDIGGMAEGPRSQMQAALRSRQNPAF